MAFSNVAGDQNLAFSTRVTESIPSIVTSPSDRSSSERIYDFAGDTAFSGHFSGYEGIDWSRLSGYSISRHRRRPRTGWVWEHGYDIENNRSGHRFWVCKACHQKRSTMSHMYDAASTSQANNHMADVHRINRDGPMAPREKRQRTLLDIARLDSRQPKEQTFMNAFIASFDSAHFQQLLIRWVACDNVPFHKLESPFFRDLMAYAIMQMLPLLTQEVFLRIPLCGSGSCGASGVIRV